MLLPVDEGSKNKINQMRTSMGIQPQEQSWWQTALQGVGNWLTQPYGEETWRTGGINNPDYQARDKQFYDAMGGPATGPGEAALSLAKGAAFAPAMAMAGYDTGMRGVNTGVAGTMLLAQGAEAAATGGVYSNPLLRDEFQLSDIPDTYAKTWESEVTAGQAIAQTTLDTYLNVADVVFPGAREKANKFVMDDMANAMADPYNERGLYSWSMGMHSDFDIFNEQQRESAYNQGIGRWVSGGIDATIQWYAGPDVLALKAAGKIGRTAFIRNFDSLTDINKASTELSQHAMWLEGEKTGVYADGAKRTDLGRLVESFTKMDEPTVFNHAIAKNSSDRVLVSRALGRAQTFDQASTALKALIGDKAAIDALFKADPIAGDALMKASDQLKSAEDMYKFWEHWASNAGDATAVDDMLYKQAQNVDRLQNVFDAAKAENRSLAAAIATVDVQAKIPNAVRMSKIEISKLGFGPKSVGSMEKAAEKGLARETGSVMWRSSAFTSGENVGRTVRVWRSGVDYMKSSRINGHIRLDSADDVMAEMDAMLQTSPMLRKLAMRGPEELLPGTQMKVADWRESVVNRLLSADTATKRMGVWQSFEKELFEATKAHYGLDSEIAARVLRRYESYRTGVLKQVQERGWIEDAGEIHVLPELQSLLAQSMPTIDMRFIENVFRLEYGSSSAARFAGRRGVKGSKILNAMDALWRPLVLMRLGYTFRNVAEGDLRDLAAFGTLSAFSQRAISKGGDPLDSPFFRWATNMGAPYRAVRYGTMRKARDGVDASVRTLSELRIQREGVQAHRDQLVAQLDKWRSRIEAESRRQVQAETKAGLRSYAERVGQSWEAMTDETLGRITEIMDGATHVIIDPEYVRPFLGIGGKRSNYALGYESATDARSASAIKTLDRNINELPNVAEDIGLPLRNWDEVASTLSGRLRSEFEALIPKADSLTEAESKRFNQLINIAHYSAVRGAERNGDVVVRITKPGQYEIVRDAKSITASDMDAGTIALVRADDLDKIKYVRSNVLGGTLDLRISRPNLETMRSQLDAATAGDDMESYAIGQSLYSKIFGDPSKLPASGESRGAMSTKHQLSQVKWILDEAEADPKFADALATKMWIEEMGQTESGAHLVEWMRNNKLILTNPEIKRLQRQSAGLARKAENLRSERDHIRQQFIDNMADDSWIFENTIDPNTGESFWLNKRTVAGHAGMRVPDDKFIDGIESSIHNRSNIQGPGFYTTVVPSENGGYIDAAISNVRNGAIDGEPVIYIVSHKRRNYENAVPDFLDLDKTIASNEDDLDLMQKIIQPVWQRLQLDKPMLDDLDEVLFAEYVDGARGFHGISDGRFRSANLPDGMVQGDGYGARQPLVADYMHSLLNYWTHESGIDSPELWEEFWTAWSDELMHQGYLGLKHLGGGLAGGGQSWHDVYIWYQGAKLTRMDTLSDEALNIIAMGNRADAIMEKSTSRLAAANQLAKTPDSAAFSRGTDGLGNRQMSLLTAYMQETGKGRLLVNDPATGSGTRVIVNPAMIVNDAATVDAAFPGSLMKYDAVDEAAPRILSDVAAADANVWKPSTDHTTMLYREFQDNPNIVNFVRGRTKKLSPEDSARLVRFMILNEFTHIQIAGASRVQSAAKMLEGEGKGVLVSASELLGKPRVSAAYAARYPADDAAARAAAAFDGHSEVQSIKGQIAETDKQLAIKLDEIDKQIEVGRAASAKLTKRLGRVKSSARLPYQYNEMVDLALPGGGSVSVPGALNVKNQGMYQAELAGSGSRVAQDLYGYADFSLAHMTRAASPTKFTPGDSHYWDILAEQLNHFYRNDPISSMVLSGASKDEIMTMLFSTQRGRSWIRQSDEFAPFRKYIDKDVLDQDARELFNDKVDAYFEDLHSLIPDQELRQFVGSQDVTADLLRTRLGWRADLQPIQGYEYLHRDMSGWRKVTGTIMHHLGTMPENKLVRHPFYRQRWNEEMQRQVNLYAEQGVEEFTPDVINAMTRVAQKWALKQVNETLYTIQRVSTPAHMFRFVMPFFPAWASSMRFWMLKMPIEKPENIARYAMAWNAPESAGWVIDNNGNKVEPKGNLVERVTDKFIGNENNSVVVQISPQWQEKLSWLTQGQGRLSVSKGSLDVMLQGDYPFIPGFGPLVTIPFAWLASLRPDVATAIETGNITGTGLDSFISKSELTTAIYRSLVPFGSPTSEKDLIDAVSNSVTPAAMQKFVTGLRGENSAEFRNMAAEIHRTNMTDYDLAVRDWEAKGEVGTKPVAPSYFDAVDQAGKFYGFRGIVNLVAPFAPQFRSKYQMYADAYRQISKDAKASGFGTEEADKYFIDLYGPEFFRYTKSLSGSSSGMGANVGEYKEATTEPQLMAYLANIGVKDDATFITMATRPYAQAQNESGYDPAVRAWQMDRPIDGAPGKYYRGGNSGIQLEKNIEKERGWDAFNNTMTQLEAVLASRGFTDFQQDPALDSVRVQLIGGLREKYPAWAFDYEQIGNGKYIQSVQGIEGLLKVGSWWERHQSDPYAQTVKKFYEYRAKFVELLKARGAAGGSSNIDAKSNQGVALAWAQVLQQLYQMDPSGSFADMHRRFFSNDPLKSVPSILDGK